MSRAVRVEAAVQEGLTSYDWYMFNADSGLEYAVEEAIATALTASDALLRTDEAQGYAISALRSHIDDLTPAEAETIIKDITAALLGEGE